MRSGHLLRSHAPLLRGGWRGVNQDEVFLSRGTSEAPFTSPAAEGTGSNQAVVCFLQISLSVSPVSVCMPAAEKRTS
jgi:hypothetical protein